MLLHRPRFSISELIRKAQAKINDQSSTGDGLTSASSILEEELIAAMKSATITEAQPKFPIASALSKSAPAARSLSVVRSVDWSLFVV